MADVKFGINAIGKPTPQWATNVFRIVLYTCAIGSIIVGTISEIPDPAKVMVLKYCSEFTLLTHAISKMFGIVIPDQNSN